MSPAISGLTGLATAAATTPAPSPKVVKAATDFESMLISKWLEEVQQGLDEESSDDAGHDTCMSIAAEALAQGVTAAGGLGLSRMLLKHLGPQEKNSLAGLKELPEMPMTKITALK
jgi:Rod binding domain-containing protein